MLVLSDRTDSVSGMDINEFLAIEKYDAQRRHPSRRNASYCYEPVSSPSGAYRCCDTELASGACPRVSQHVVIVR